MNVSSFLPFALSPYPYPPPCLLCFIPFFTCILGGTFIFCRCTSLTEPTGVVKGQGPFKAKPLPKCMVKNSENQLSALHPSGGGGTPHFKWQGGVRDFGGVWNSRFRNFCCSSQSFCHLSSWDFLRVIILVQGIFWGFASSPREFFQF